MLSSFAGGALAIWKKSPRLDMASPPTPFEFPEQGDLRACVLAMRQAFAVAGTDAPRLEAELLLGHVLGCGRGELLARLHETLTPTQREALSGLARRRLGREPVAYLLGRREFYGREFFAAPGALVPRPETETLIELARRRLPGDAEGWALDVGTGSGCLAVTLALEFSRLRVLAVDLSADALKVARRNAERFGVAARVRFVRGDGLAALRPEPRFRLIVANPPYIDPEEEHTLPPEVRDHEPPLALYGGLGGTQFTQALLLQMAPVLLPSACGLIEFGERQGETLRRAALSAGFSVARLHPDLSGIERVLEVSAGG